MGQFSVEILRPPGSLLGGNQHSVRWALVLGTEIEIMGTYKIRIPPAKT